MRKLMITVLILLLLVTIGFMIFNSLNIGNLQILGVSGLNEENKKLDASIQTLSRLSSTDYQQALADVTISSKQYEESKKEYDDLVTVSTDSEVTTANQLQKYEIEYLWTRIGNHATSENVVLKLEIKANSTSQATGYYDLAFTATGDYVGITDFIYDIENDSSLGFKIENFKMEPAGNGLQGTFTCTNVAINIDPSEISGNNSTTENSEENSENKTTDRQNGEMSQATEEYLQKNNGNNNNTNNNQ
ncbi:MAG: hypothetical protein IKF17_01220 [Clostridia bacterium]|nr:hypothetical protein [Clostridia bacterium]